MIPWRLTFSGVRDFPARKIDLSGEIDHIGVFGPNGVGKSTITFCMGAALYSGKVDIDGLRSANLDKNQSWRATISFLFKNEGAQIVDAAKYVQFTVYIEQTASTIVREFEIAEGDEIDIWTSQTTFKSGDKTNNFSAYKEKIRHKYSIDPDYYYLIWYQNEVNQFSDMAPEERFRIFSEMHGIDTIQKNWEESIDLVKEATVSLEEAKLRQKQNKMNLNQMKQRLNQYEDNQKRLKDGYKTYFQSMYVLDGHYQREIHELDRKIEENEKTKEMTSEARNELQTTFSKNKEKLSELEKKMKSLQNQLQSLDVERMQHTNHFKQLKEEKEKLDQEIAHIQEMVQRIPLTEQEVYSKLHKTNQTIKQKEEEKQKKEVQLNNIESYLNRLRDELAQLSQRMNEDIENEKSYKELLDEYIGSYQVNARIKDLEDQLDSSREDIRSWNQELGHWQSELVDLENNKFYSKRQYQSKKKFELDNIRVFALRDLIELDQSARLQDEIKFNSIKYTMFVDQRTFIPPNDLYHVPLPDVVPERSISNLPKWKIKVKATISEADFPFATKALWWVQELFESSEATRIENGVLVDSKGRRGQQEETKYILSEAALVKRKNELKHKVIDRNQAILQTEETVKKAHDEREALRRVVAKVERAEAFFTNTNERVLRQKKYEKQISEKNEKLEEQKNVSKAIADLRDAIANHKAVGNQLEDYKLVYEKVYKERAKIEKSRQLTEQMKEIQKKIELAKHDYEVRGGEYDHLHRNETKIKRDNNQVKQHLEDVETEIRGVSKSISKQIEEKNTSRNQFLLLQQEIQALKEITPEKVYREENFLENLPSWSKSEAMAHKETGKITFDHAVHEEGIDPEAPENYKKMKEEYDRSSAEVTQSDELLAKHKERAEQLRGDLDNTITVQILNIRQHFTKYMDQFGFETVLDWDMMEDKKGNIRYYLYIKARKYGHQMKMEDVSNKARGNRHGKGLSGGERSLVSLLYALALLQTIETNPSFIVLDEFDSALDEGRKVKVFDLYVQELQRKMIVFTPKTHDESYLKRFAKAYVVYHNPDIPMSDIIKLKSKKTVETF